MVLSRRLSEIDVGFCLLVVGCTVAFFGLFGVLGYWRWLTHSEPSPYKVVFAASGENCGRNGDMLFLDFQTGEQMACGGIFGELGPPEKWTSKESDQVTNLAVALAEDEGSGRLSYGDRTAIEDKVDQIGAAHGYPKKRHFGSGGVVVMIPLVGGVLTALLGRRRRMSTDRQVLS